jgi:hypothetical protein
LADDQARVMNRKYERWEEFFDEAELMCANAFKYNEDDSEVYADAQQIKVSFVWLVIRLWGNWKLMARKFWIFTDT